VNDDLPDQLEDLAHRIRCGTLTAAQHRAQNYTLNAGPADRHTRDPDRYDAACLADRILLLHRTVIDVIRLTEKWTQEPE
jgi:hypothetical protein